MRALLTALLMVLSSIITVLVLVVLQRRARQRSSPAPSRSRRLGARRGRRPGTKSHARLDAPDGGLDLALEDVSANSPVSGLPKQDLYEEAGAEAPVLGESWFELGMPQALPDTVLMSAQSGAVLQFGYLGNHAVRGLTMRGADHALPDETGDDAAAMAALDDGCLLAVADGVGSELHARECAIAAVEGLVTGYRKAEGVVEDRIAAAYAVAARAVARTRTLNGSGATTLTCAVLSCTPSGVEVVTATVGDTAVLALTPHSALVDLAREAPDESTRALPMHDSPILRRALLPPGSVIAVASDGFLDGLQHQSGALVQRVQTGWREPPHPANFATDVMFRGDYYYDDRTVVAAWPR